MSWAVFISGRGSNLQALLDEAADLDLRWVLSSKAKAPGLRRARRAGVPISVLSQPIDWTSLDLELRRRGISKIFLAGFMKLIPASFLQNWQGRILNIHPSLLPAYPGLRAWERAWQEGASMGVTVHVVEPEMDAGPRLLQAKIRGEMKTLTPSQVALKVAVAEQALVPRGVSRWK